MRLMIFIAIYFMFSGVANACGYGQFKFGASFEKLAKTYNLDEEFEPTDDYVEIPVRGTSVCAELSGDVRARLVFIKDSLVQIKMEKLGVNTTLLDFAEDKFGEVPKPGALDVHDPKMQHIWAKKNKSLIIYSVENRSGKTVEYLEITSLDHKELFDGAYVDLEEEIQNTRRIGE